MKPKSIIPLSDIHHPVTQAKAKELYNAESGAINNFKRIFYYVRDEIPFGFPKAWDWIPASTTIQDGIGYCNSKAILMQALCQLNNIPVKLRAGQIDVQIMKGVFPIWAFPFIDSTASHMWIEVQLEHRWYPIDAYILDHEFYVGAKNLLIENNLSMGFGLGSIDLVENGDWFEGFIQTDAIAEDNGSWSEATAFYNSALYNRLSAWQKMAMPLLRTSANRKIRKIRQYGQNIINTQGVGEALEFVI